LALRRGWSRLLAPIRRAYDVLGPIDPAVARATGLDPATPVLTGIHDSNANYLRYLAQPTRDWTLLSTGTWLITFNPAGSVDALEAARDTCTNTDVFGQPVPCSRFMIGREFERVAGPEGMAAAATPADVTAVIGKGAMALPSFTDMGGPVPGSSGSGRLIGADDLAAGERRALALLYVALMTDLALDAVGAADRLIVDGPLAQEPLFGPLLAAVRQASVELDRCRRHDRRRRTARQPRRAGACPGPGSQACSAPSATGPRHLRAGLDRCRPLRGKLWVGAEP
ncbi:MAG: hypothetical protein AAFX81_20595, partial [Pseudomonadota bacterium]